MPQKKWFPLLAFAALVLSLTAVPLTAQSTQPTTDGGKSTTQSTTKDKSKKKTDKSTTSAATPASGSTTPATGGQTASTPAKAAAPQTATPPQKGMVWVNTASGVYHYEGAKYYGKTKEGKYMTEADAQKAGYHAAKGESGSKKQ